MMAGLIDCDVHCAVPSKHVLMPYLPEQWQEFMQVSTFRQPEALDMVYPPWSLALRTSGLELTLPRIQAEVLTGVDLAILHCYYGVEAFTHPYLSAAVATAVNEWLRHEWLDRDDRLRASAVITPQYTEHAVAEVHRIAEDPRFVQLLVPARAPNGYGNQRYWPIWEAAAEHGLPVAIVFGGVPAGAPTPVNWLDSFFEFYVTGTQPFHSHVTSLCLSGVFDRWPKLKFVLAESGWTSLPALLWRMDQEWKALWREVPWMTAPPSAYFREHFRVTTQPTDAPVEHLAAKLEELPGRDLLMFGSDYPHRSSPSAEELFGLLGDDAERVTHLNAEDWYRLEVPAPAGGGG
jgi:uncharacterized protein